MTVFTLYEHRGRPSWNFLDVQITFVGFFIT